MHIHGDADSTHLRSPADPPNPVAGPFIPQSHLLGEKPHYPPTGTHPRCQKERHLDLSLVSSDGNERHSRHLGSAVLLLQAQPYATLSGSIDSSC